MFKTGKAKEGIDKKGRCPLFILNRIGLNERQRKAVDFIKVSKKITNKDLRRLTNAIYRTVSRDLDDLIKKGLFRKVGKTGRGTYYVLAGKTGHK